MSDVKREEKAYLKVLKHLSDDEGYPIGSYVGMLRRKNTRYRKLIKVLSSPDLIAKKVYESNPDLKYVNANHMVTWIVEESNKVLEGEEWQLIPD